MEYQGFKNYQTWNVIVWSTNDRGTYELVKANKPYDIAKVEKFIREVLFPNGTQDVKFEELKFVDWEEVCNAFNEL